MEFQIHESIGEIEGVTDESASQLLFDSEDQENESRLYAGLNIQDSMDP